MHETGRRALSSRECPICHTRLMDENSPHDIGIDAKPTYQASLRFRCGVIARVTVIDGEALVDFRDDDGRAASARMTGTEATEVASMLFAADRQI